MSQSLPTKTSAFLVDFISGSRATPVFYRYTDDVQNLQVGTETYESTPGMNIEIPAMTIGLNEDELVLTLPIDDFSDKMSDGRSVARTKVRVREIMRSEKGGSFTDTLTYFIGEVKSTIRNPSGKENVVEFRCVNAKSSLDQSLGLSCNHHCIWTFGGAGCEVDLSNLRQIITVVSISGLRVTLDDGGGAGGNLKGKANGYWVNGYLEYHGVIIKIRDWAGTGSGSFVLNRKAPPEFAGNTNVNIYPGCDKRYSTCVNRWGRQSRFGGFGIGIPEFNPIIEVIK